MAVTVIVNFKSKAGQRDALVEFLKGVQPGALAAGCKNIAVHQNVDAEDHVVEVEHWDSKNAHVKFVEAAAAAGAFKPFEAMLAEPFKVDYLEVQKHSQA